MADRNSATRSAILLLIAIALLGVMSVLVVKYMKGPPLRTLPTRAYFYDLDSGKLFVDDLSRVPPIAPPSSTTGRLSAVKAHVFTCGECNEKDRYIGYLETGATPGSRTSESTDASPPPAVRGGAAVAGGGGGMIAALDAPDKWYSRASREGQRVIALAMMKCGGGKRATNCDPP